MSIATDEQGANNFTALRLLLAVMVVLGHFKLLVGGASSRFPFNLADAGVDCFFVVSGFMITGSVERSKGVLAFYTRRVFRLVPMYVFVVIAQTGVIVALLPGGPLSAVTETVRYIVCNLLFANFLQPDIGGILQSDLAVSSINPSLWTLKIEIGFYLIVPIIHAAVRRWGVGVLAVLFAGSALYEIIAVHLGLDRYAKQLPGQLQFFAVGMALYLYAHRIRVGPVMAVAVSVAFLAAWTWLWPIPAVVRPLLVGAFVFCFALRLPILPLRADLSYSVYLLHGPVIQTLLLLGLLQDRLWMLGAVLIGVLTLSLVTERLVEQPGIRLGKRLARRLEQVPLSGGLLRSGLSSG
jgi:peptidoglycan/LPS O-acetylase OafA/YrhL